MLKGFMLDFMWHGKFWTIDAARDDGTLGRLVNDDHINPNSKMKRIIVEGKPHLCLFALRDVLPGEEITYNYGDGDYSWRIEVKNSGPEADTSHLELAGASGDDPHCTQHSQNKSAFSTEVADGMFAGDQYCILYTVEPSTSQLHEVSSHDACSISSLENSEDEYVPESSYSSSDTSACSHTIPSTKNKAKTKKKSYT